MALNIKNPRTNELVSKLADLMDISLTEAVTVAVEEKLRRMETSEDDVERILGLGRDCARRLPQWLIDSNPNDLLYDASGLPH